MLRIAIIIGSTRPGRKGEAVAKWAENFRVFKPASNQEKHVHVMLDQVIAWSGALRPLRNMGGE
jgi:hypothetical protein